MALESEKRIAALERAVIELKASTMAAESRQRGLEKLLEEMAKHSGKERFWNRTFGHAYADLSKHELEKSLKELAATDSDLARAIERILKT